MDHDGCKVMYLDRRAQNEQTWTQELLVEPSDIESRSLAPSKDESGHNEVEQNVRSLLSIFPEGELYHC